MFPFKISSFALSLVLSPFLVFPAGAEGIAQNSGGAPTPADNTVFSNPASVINATTTNTSVQGATVTINDGVATVTVPTNVASALGTAMAQIIAILSAPTSSPSQQALLNTLSNLRASAVLSTNQTTDAIVVTDNQGGTTVSTETLNTFSQAIETVQSMLAGGFSVGSTIQIQYGNSTVTLSPL